MQTTKVTAKQHNNQPFDVIFVTVNIQDIVFFQILNRQDTEMTRNLVMYIANKMLDYYEITCQLESISIGKISDEDIYLEIVPNKKMEGDILEAIARDILPKSLILPIWKEWNENEFLAEIVEVMDEYDFEDSENAADISGSPEFSTYKIPSLSKLLDFSKISGCVVENDGVLYLRTKNELSEFFENCKEPLPNATVVVPNVEKMLEMMQKVNPEQEEIEK